MPMHLIAEEGPLKGKVLLFDEDKDEFIIGRDTDQSDIVLDDPTVSRKHVRCIKEADGLCILDLSHTNPILVNDQALTEEHLLQEGDKIKIGQNVFLYSEEEVPVFEEDIHEEKPEEELGAETIFLEDTPEKEEPIFATTYEEEPLVTDADKTQKKEEETTAYDTIFEDLEDTSEIYPFLEEPKLVLKVLTGPNTGAEFALEKNKSYLLGKDPNTCDIAFNDLSVSRHHANLTVDAEGMITIEDLGSKNKSYVNSHIIETKEPITSQDLISLGTTTFVIIDKEAETETIYTPFVSPTKEEETKEEEIKEEQSKPSPGLWRREQIIPFKHLIIAACLGFVCLISVISFFSLFKSHEVPIEIKDVTQDIQKTLKKYEGITFSYNPRSENLFLTGHVLTSIDKQEMTYDIQQVPYIEHIEDTVIIDELVWKSINDLLSANETWRGVAIHSSAPGHFVVTGYIKTTKDAEELSDYLNMNFPYVDNLENKVVVEDILQAKISALIKKIGFDNVSFGVTNGDVILTGQYNGKIHRKFEALLQDLHKLEGVKEVTNLALATSEDSARVDVSQKYKVSGYAKFDGHNYSIVIGGHILGIGDLLDGMKITSILENMILLEKDDIKYKINYSQESQ